jgi:hypothetical protein
MAPAGGLAGRARRPSDDVVRMQDAVHLKTTILLWLWVLQESLDAFAGDALERRRSSVVLSPRARLRLSPCLVYSRVWRIALISSANC